MVHHLGPAESEQLEQCQLALSPRQRVMDSLRKIFHDGDTDGSGELDMDELHALICKHQAAQWDWPKGLTQPDVN